MTPSHAMTKIVRLALPGLSKGRLRQAIRDGYQDLSPVCVSNLFPLAHTCLAAKAGL